jgi:predicted transcriptional regulator
MLPRDAIVSIKDLERFEGQFFWDEKVLRRHISSIKPDYNPFDPMTWPFFDEGHIKFGTNKNGSAARMLPTRVAYTYDLMTEKLQKKYNYGLLDHGHTVMSRVGCDDYTGQFRNYALNFNFQGVVRDPPNMSMHSHDLWMHNWGAKLVQPAAKRVILSEPTCCHCYIEVGPAWLSDCGHVYCLDCCGLGDYFQCSACGSTVEHIEECNVYAEVEDSTMDEGPTASPENTYGQVMKLLAEEEFASSADMDRIKKELGDTQQNLTNHIKKTEKAQRCLKIAEEQLNTSKEELKTSKNELLNAQKKALDMETKLEKMSEELLAAQKVKEETNQRMGNILAQLIKLKNAKASSESGNPKKRAHEDQPIMKRETKEPKRVKVAASNQDKYAGVGDWV